MKFRNSRNRQAVTDVAALLEEEFAAMPTEEAARGRWSTAFLVVGSALMGATALALWNRRTITSMRAQIEAMSGTGAPPSPVKDEEIF